jgi:hypothetical protein
MSTEPPLLDRLAEPPRPLPPALAARLRLNGAFFVGVVWLALSSVGLIWALRYSPLPGEWHLLRDRREAPGWLLAVQEHQHKDKRQHVTTSYSYRYEFQLPDGRRLSGESSSDRPLHQAPRHPNPKGAADVTVEYHPQRVEANRLKGTRSSSGGPFILFGLLLPVIGLLITGGGLWSGWKRSRLLRLGLPSSGYIDTCRLPAKRSHGSAQMGESTVSWSSSSSQPALPLAEFREQIWAQHRANLAMARKMQENSLARGCGWTLALVIAFFFGGGITAMLLVITVLIVMSLLDFPGNQIVPVALVMGGAGELLGTVLLMRWFIRKERQRLSPETAKARPAAFNQVECTLNFWLADGQSTGQTQRTLSLTGDDEDEEPRALLYDSSRPARTLFVSEFDLPLQVDEEGQWSYAGAWPVFRLVLIVLALSVPIIGWFLMEQ